MQNLLKFDELECLTGVKSVNDSGLFKVFFKIEDLLDSLEGVREKFSPIISVIVLL